MQYCKDCKHFNDWQNTYVKKEPPYINSCCSYWHIAYNIYENPSLRQKECFVPKNIYVQLSINFDL